MESVYAICDFIFGSAGSFVFGLAVGVAIVSGLWIRDIEKPWRPTDEEAVESDEEPQEGHDFDDIGVDGDDV